jgi:hypothetical protein
MTPTTGSATATTGESCRDCRDEARDHDDWDRWKYVKRSSWHHHHRYYYRALHSGVGADGGAELKIHRSIGVRHVALIGPVGHPQPCLDADLPVLSDRLRARVCPVPSRGPLQREPLGGTLIHSSKSELSALHRHVVSPGSRCV